MTLDVLDRSTIAMLINIAYCALFIIAWFSKWNQNKDKLRQLSSLSTAEQREYLAYSAAFVVPGIVLTSFRNFYVFNNWVPVTFIIQFAVQFIILVCFVLPENKVSRYIASFFVGTFLIFGVLNGLFLKNPKYTTIEDTAVEVEKLSNDIDTFTDQLSSKLKKVNEDFLAIQLQLTEQQKQALLLKELVSEKQTEHKKLTSIIEIDKNKASEILTTLNIRPPTIWDRIADGVIGAIIGLFFSILYNRTLGKKTSVAP